MRDPDGRNFYSRPCGRGDLVYLKARSLSRNFYSRPCGRGDALGVKTNSGNS